MKKLFLFIPIIFLSLSSYAQVTHTWDGGAGTNNFSDDLNWDTDQVPDFSDNIVFDGALSNSNCDFDATGPYILNDISVLPSYTGTINCGTEFIFVQGNFTLSGGTFLSTSDILSFQASSTGSRSISLGGTAVFLHNSSTVRVTPIAGETITFSGAFPFNILQITKTATGTQSNINLGSGITVASSFAFTGNQPVSFQGNINLNGSIQARNTSTVIPTSNTAIWTISGTAAQTFSGTTGPARGYLPNIVINKTGALTLVNGTAYNLNNSNWTHTAGTYLANTTSTLNAYGTCSIITTGATVDHLVINTGATLTAPAGILNLRGNFINDGTFNHNNGTVTFARTASVTVQSSIGGSTSPTTFYSINTTNVSVANTKTITLNTDINIVNSIDINNNIKLNTNSRVLRLLSDNTRRAYIAAGGTNAQIIGNITVNTFAKSGFTGWTTLGVAGVTGNTFANWEDDMIMTCVGCPLGTNLGGTTFVSITGYDEPTATYPDKVYGDALTPGTGYWVYLGTSSVSTTNQTITTVGPAVQGNVNVSLTRGFDGFNLISNPYAAPITWASVFTTNSARVNNAIYVWNPDLAGGTGAFAQRVGGISSPTGVTGVGASIPAGQGFYVEATSAGTFSFTEAHKSAANTANTLLKTNGALNDSIVLEPGDSVADIIPQNVFRLKLSGANNFEDETVFHFNTNATQNFDQMYDARKYGLTPSSTYISSKLNGVEYAINALAFESPSNIIPVKVISPQTSTYTISPIDINEIPGTGCVILHDNYLNVAHNLRTGPYVCTIADSTTQARFTLEVCANSIVTSVNSLENSNNMNVFQNEQGTFVKTRFASNTKATISAYNVMGQKIMADMPIEGTELTTRLNLNIGNQIVIIKVATDKETTSKKVFVN